ncbi:MAG TPA: extracellular solute-binding protein [Actinomycetota bacterium]|nr:extracellular solute-binding protein [Actinomycetota bacterium]
MKQHQRGRAAVAVAGVLAFGVTACSSKPSTTPPAGSPSSGGSTGKTTIVFAESGLGTEGQQTQVAINDFMRANPDIKVTVNPLSSDSTTYLQQLENSFIAGSSTPDVFESDVTYPAKFAQAGWVLPLDSFSPDMSQYFAVDAAAGVFNGKTYAVPWFANPEGLFYRTDLIKTPPTTPAQVISDAQAAMAADKNLKEGIAFEGAKYEGAITSFLTVDSAFGGKLDPNNLNTPGNQAALQFLHDAIFVNKTAPQAVTGWQEGQVEQEFVAGNAAFAIDYPFVESSAVGTAVSGSVGYIPFPADPTKGGTPGAAVGGEMLAINAKTKQAAASWKLIQYLTSPSVETARAEATADPPSLQSAYTPDLLAKAPYFAQVEELNKDAQARPVNPNYLQVSTDLQTMFSAVYANQQQPAAALSATATKVKADANATAGP